MPAATQKFVIRVALLSITLCCAALADPLNDQDNGGIPGVFHFPDSTDGAIFPDRGKLAVSVLMNTSSHALNVTSGPEELMFDGETTRMELGLRYGLGSRFEIGIDVPYQWHESGGLDNFIDTWHDAIGFGSGERAKLPTNELQLSYLDASGSRFLIEQNTKGIGDLRLVAGWRISDGPRSTTALRFSASIPTGDSAALLGSGGTNISVGLAGDVQTVMGVDRLNGFYRLHATRVGEPDILADRYREYVGQLSAGLGFDLTKRVELRAQASLRSAVYDSDIEILGQSSVTLTVGGNIKLTDHYFLDIAVGEDVKVESAPDVSLQLAIRYRPGE